MRPIATTLAAVAIATAGLLAGTAGTAGTAVAASWSSETPRIAGCPKPPAQERVQVSGLQHGTTPMAAPGIRYPHCPGPTR